MKRVTVLQGFGHVGKIVIKVVSDSKDSNLMRDEHDEKHERLVQAIHETMSSQGCWSHKIKVRP